MDVSITQSLTDLACMVRDRWYLQSALELLQRAVKQANEHCRHEDELSKLSRDFSLATACFSSRSLAAPFCLVQDNDGMCFSRSFALTVIYAVNGALVINSSSKYGFTSTEAWWLIRDGRAPLTSSDTQSRELSETNSQSVLFKYERLRQLQGRLPTFTLTQYVSQGWRSLLLTSAMVEKIV